MTIPAKNDGLFTDSAWKALMLANQEAQRMDHPKVCTHHMLLGLLKEGTVGVLPYGQVRAEVEKRVKPGAIAIRLGRLPMTRLAYAAFADAAVHSFEHDKPLIDVDDLLQGLMESDGVASQILQDSAAGADLKHMVRELAVTTLSTKMLDAVRWVVETDRAVMDAYAKKQHPLRKHCSIQERCKALSNLRKILYQIESELKSANENEGKELCDAAAKGRARRMADSELARKLGELGEN